MTKVGADLCFLGGSTVCAPHCGGMLGMAAIWAWKSLDIHVQSNTALGALSFSGALLRLVARYVKFLVPIPGRGVLYAPRNAYTSSRVLYLLRRSRQAPFCCKHAKQYLKINTAYFGIAGGWISPLLQLKRPLYSYPFR